MIARIALATSSVTIEDSWGSVHHLPQSVRPCAYNGFMKTKTLRSSPQTLQDLQDFLFDTMAPADLAVDWFCDRFNVSATDDVIDFVVDAHFGMFADQ